MMLTTFLAVQILMAGNKEIIISPSSDFIRSLKVIEIGGYQLDALRTRSLNIKASVPDGVLAKEGGVLSLPNGLIVRITALPRSDDDRRLMSEIYGKQVRTTPASLWEVGAGVWRVSGAVSTGFLEKSVSTLSQRRLTIYGFTADLDVTITCELQWNRSEIFTALEVMAAAFETVERGEPR